MTGEPSPVRFLYVLPAIDDRLDEKTKSAIALRNTCAVEGACPACGTVGALRLDREGVYHLTFEHDDECPVLRDPEKLT